MPGRYVVVVGCGRFGSTLANAWSQQGDSVVVVDRDPRAFSLLASEFSGFRIVGDAAVMGVLREAKVGQADIVCAATPLDNLNLFVAVAARELFDVKQVAARVFDPALEAVFDEMGVIAVSPTTLTAEAFLLSLAGPFE
jgi:trk system potassium uptake protein TrkA